VIVAWGDVRYRATHTRHKCVDADKVPSRQEMHAISRLESG